MTGPADFNTAVVEEFRANRGVVGGPFEGRTVLLLHTTGARSGAPARTSFAAARALSRPVTSRDRVKLNKAIDDIKVFLDIFFLS